MTEPAFLTTTRAAYDTVAVDYARLVGAEVTAAVEGPQDRAALAAFVELVKDRGSRPVADLGCGPGRITSHLAASGLSVFGVDLSPEMVTIARRAHPGLRFEEGSITALPLAEGALGGVVAWYSIIHTPPEQLPLAFAEFQRVLAPGGQLLLAFQAGDDEHVRRDEAYGHAVRLDSYRLLPDHVAELLQDAGLVVHAQLLREPSYPHEKTPQAFLMAHKPGV